MRGRVHVSFMTYFAFYSLFAVNINIFTPSSRCNSKYITFSFKIILEFLLFPEKKNITFP